MPTFNLNKNFPQNVINSQFSDYLTLSLSMKNPFLYSVCLILLSSSSFWIKSATLQSSYLNTIFFSFHFAKEKQNEREN